MHHFLKPIHAFAISMIFLLSAESYAGYGDVAGGLPSWKERQIVVLTNACRMSPAQYRDSYVGNYAILVKYPAVPPLYFNQNLGKSAHAHGLDMGDTCGILQHLSCNKTYWGDRIKSYYKISSMLGENIAGGNSDPFATMNQWIMDIPQGSNQPTADSSICTSSTGTPYFCDGHRSNIMNPSYKELGTGYTYGTNSALRFHDFWVQDFGGGQSAILSPIIGGTHFFKESAKTTFLVNYWDPDFKTPTEATVYIAGQKYAMTLGMGSAYRGTYQLSLPRSGGCRMYYFSFVDGTGKAWRYPEQGAFLSTDEGGCAREYLHPESLWVYTLNSMRSRTSGRLRSKANNRAIIIYIPNSSIFPQSTFLFDGQGRLLQRCEWDHVQTLPGVSKSQKLNIVLDKKFSNGIYFLVHKLSDMQCFYEKVSIIFQ